MGFFGLGAPAALDAGGGLASGASFERAGDGFNKAGSGEIHRARPRWLLPRAGFGVEHFLPEPMVRSGCRVGKHQQCHDRGGGSPSCHPARVPWLERAGQQSRAGVWTAPATGSDPAGSQAARRGIRPSRVGKYAPPGWNVPARSRPQGGRVKREIIPAPASSLASRSAWTCHDRRVSPTTSARPLAAAADRQAQHRRDQQPPSVPPANPFHARLDHPALAGHPPYRIWPGFASLIGAGPGPTDAKRRTLTFDPPSPQLSSCDCIAPRGAENEGASSCTLLRTGTILRRGDSGRKASAVRKDSERGPPGPQRGRLTGRKPQICARETRNDTEMLMPLAR